MKRIISLVICVLALVCSMFAQGGQPSFAIQPVLSQTTLPFGSFTTVTTCMTNTGTDNSFSVPVGAVQVFNFDVQLGTVSGVSSITVSNPIPVQPTANPISAADFTVNQGVGNPNKVIFNYTPVMSKDWPAGTNVCVDVTIDTTLLS